MHGAAARHMPFQTWHSFMAFVQGNAIPSLQISTTRQESVRIDAYDTPLESLGTTE